MSAVPYHPIASVEALAPVLKVPSSAKCWNRAAEFSALAATYLASLILALEFFIFDRTITIVVIN